MSSPCCPCVCVSPPNNSRMPEPTFMKLGMYIHDTWAYLNRILNDSLPSVCASVYIYPHIVARQQLCKNVTGATNTHAIIEELLDASLPVCHFSDVLTEHQGFYRYIAIPIMPCTAGAVYGVYTGERQTGTDPWRGSEFSSVYLLIIKYSIHWIWILYIKNLQYY
jgi:hypothetical protein